MRFSARHARTPRSMRFVADVSIQLLLTEPTALVTAVGFIQVYKFMYPDYVKPLCARSCLGIFRTLCHRFGHRCGLQHFVGVASSPSIQHRCVKSLELKELACPFHRQHRYYPDVNAVLYRILVCHHQNEDAPS